jgi:hypothetical protein
MLYKIIEGFNTEQMKDYIQPELDEGWTLHGNLVLITYLTEDERLHGVRHRPETLYAQTLKKKETPEEYDARVYYFERLLEKPLDQLTPEERKDRDDYLEDLEAETEAEAESS